MTSIAHRLPRSPHRRDGLIGRVSRRLRCGRLDRTIAAGADTWATPDLHRRSRELVRHELRRATAAELESVLARAQEPAGRPTLSAAAPLAGAEIRAAAPQLRALALDLEHADHVNARGVALARQLIRDGGSPLYAGASLEPGEALPVRSARTLELLSDGSDLHRTRRRRVRRFLPPDRGPRPGMSGADVVGLVVAALLALYLLYALLRGEEL